MPRIVVSKKSAAFSPPKSRQRLSTSHPVLPAENAVPQFLLYLEMELGLSPNTIDAYSRDLRDCAAFCELIDRPLVGMDASALARYLQHL